MTPLDMVCRFNIIVLKPGTALLVTCLACLILTVVTVQAQDWGTMGPITPRGYVCYRAIEPIRIDGRLTDIAWQDAAWTQFFVDIRGEDWPAPRHRTRARLLWDDDYLYVSALLEEPHVWGRLIERNAVIFYDNDFEIFIDPDGDNHLYYEFELNALNTIWELTLDRPYKDGGPATHGTNIPGLRSAVHVEGSLNAPWDTDQNWSVEVAIPWSGLGRYSSHPVPPADGEQWRINFSRVEWQHDIVDGEYQKAADTSEDNWVWSPQGIVDMHRPERWGFVQFSTAKPGSDSFIPDPSLATRDLLMRVYHEQKLFRETNGRWAATLAELGLAELERTDRQPGVVRFEVTGDNFIVEAAHTMANGQHLTFSTNEESRIWQSP